MKYGVRLPNSGPLATREAITTTAVAAEQLGYDAISVHDHVVWGQEEDRYHFYAGSKELADSRDWPFDFLEAFTTQGYLAGITRKVRLIPAAICVGWRSSGILARESITLDHLSQGRFVLCCCIGDNVRDYRAANTAWEERGKSTVEALKILRTIIDNSGRSSFEGKNVWFKDEEWSPRPQRLPLWYAGTSDNAVRRAARYCDGWLGGGPDQLRNKLSEIRQEREAAGRADLPFEFASLGTTCLAETDAKAEEMARASREAHGQGPWLKYMTPSKLWDQPRTWRPARLVGTSATVAEGVQDYANAGYDLLLLHFLGHSLGALLEQIEQFAREVMPQVP